MTRVAAIIVCLAFVRVATAAPEAATFARAQQAEAELRIDEARALLRQALQEKPAAPGVAEHTAWFLFLNGFHDEECRDLLRQAAKTGQDPAAMERAARQVERELGLRGPADAEEQAAARAFHRARIEQTARAADAERGGALVDAGEFAAGIPLLEQALATEPGNGPLALRLARAYAWANRLAEADAAYAKLLATRPGNAALLRERARVGAGLAKRLPPAVEPLPPPASVAGPPAAFKQGELAEKELRIDEARDLFRQALRENPEARGVAEHVAWFLFLNNFHDEECRDLLRSAAPTAQEPAAMERAARHVERELGLRPQADAEEKAAKREFDAVMIAKAAKGTGAELGGALVDAGDFAAGVPLLERALAADPANGPLELRLARAYVWAQRQPEADAAFCRLLERHPGNAALLFEHAQVAAGRTMLERARQLLIAAERSRPGDARILLERSRIESRLVNRAGALAAVARMAPADQAGTLATLARARAEHSRGQFGPARDGYLRALAAAPHLEEAALGLAECRLRRGELAEGSQLLGSWLPRERALDWRARTDLFADLTDPRIDAEFSTYSNSLGYFEYGFGVDGRYHPAPETEVKAALVNSLFTQKGFQSIDRQGGLIDVASRPDERLALSGRLGVNGYTNSWVTPVGGLWTEVFPVHWLDVGGGAEYFNLVDFQPPFGVGIYDIVTTIGAAGEKISSTQGMLHARIRPGPGWTLYARSRVGSFTDGNLMQDEFGEVAYEFRPGPLRTRASWAYYYLTLRNDAPLYQPVPGGPATPAYYAPAALDVSTWNLEMSGRPRDRFELGGEGHLYHILENSGLGVGVFLYGKIDIDRFRVLRLDARYFTQNRGLTRQGKSAGSYDALNFLVTYDRRF
ncbi:MAG: hypothetical protein EBZ74_02505 [Planctomycetia bacterium]|nr:hypothetical protein [Planctomycetia bacterium]